MSNILGALVALLGLERIEEDIFRGQSQDLGWGTVYGGQVLGQALSAAARTVPAERRVHSLHAYFLRPGNALKSIIYQVERIRDGRSFTTRRVVAIQNGKPIFHCSASFHTEEPGFEHGDAMPNAPAPETLRTDQEHTAEHGERIPAFMREYLMSERPFEMRPVDPTDDPFAPSKRPPQHMLWLKTVGSLPDDPALHAYLLAYASDYSFVTTSLFPHGVALLTPGLQVASLDHAMWFHAPFRVDEWLLHVVDSPAARGARGFVRGRIFTQSGRLVVSTAQEGLVRQHKLL
ncbi:MAG: acyl-CoA thioesterase II [Polyangiaceae bacterium]|nr:acyl-CoA thioesterase II [Polyangiaceae bacterium]